MNNLIILVKMQLKEKLNFKRSELKDVGFFHILLSIIGAILKFAMVTVLCVAFLLVSNKLGLFSMTNTVPSSVISIVFSAMLLVSVFSCTAGLTKAMYYSRDNAVLLTLPCRPIQVYLSKLLIFFFFEFKRNMSFMVPLFIAYFYTHNYPVKFYPWMLFCFIFISFFTVSIGALLSIPTMWFCNFFRQYKRLQITSLVLLVVAAVAAITFAISLIPENIDLLATWGTTYWKIQDFLNAYTTKLPNVYDITLMLLGETRNLITTFPVAATMLRFSKLVGATAALFIAGLLIVRPLFYSMASKPFEYRKRPVPEKPNRYRHRRRAAFGNEFIVALRSSDRMFANVGILISVPLLVFLLNKIFFAMNTRALGNNMIIAFNVLIIMLIVLNSNCSASSIYSRDGRSSYLIKTQPSKPLILLLAKLIPNSVFGALAMFITFITMLVTKTLGFFEALSLVVGLGFIYLAHMFYCAELDIMNPQFEVYATMGDYESNPNEMHATVSAFIVSFACALAIFLLLLEGAGFTYLKVFLVGLALMVYRIYMYFSKIKLYYKEK